MTHGHICPMRAKSPEFVTLQAKGAWSVAVSFHRPSIVYSAPTDHDDAEKDVELLTRGPRMEILLLLV